MNSATIFFTFFILLVTIYAPKNDSESSALKTGRLRVSFNSLRNIGQHGINLREINGGEIYNNIVSSVRHAGLYTKNISNTSIKANNFSAIGENGMFDEGGGIGNIIEQNNFLQVGQIGVDKNGLSSGIFSNNSEGRIWRNNRIEGSPRMRYGFYILGRNIDKRNIVSNAVLNFRDTSFRIENRPLNRTEFK